MEQLDGTICELLKQDAPYYNIESRFDEVYDGVGYTKLCHYRHLLLCNAVHFGHKVILQYLGRETYSRYIVKPLITAVYERKLGYVKRLCCQYRQTAESHQLCPCELGYGIFNTDHKLVARTTSAMDIILQRDDAEIFSILLEELHVQPGAVVQMVLRHCAEKCFQSLVCYYQKERTKFETNQEFYFQYNKNDFWELSEQLTEAIKNMCNCAGQTTELIRNSALCVYAKIDYNEQSFTTNINFMPHELGKKLKSLPSIDTVIKAYDCTLKDPVAALASKFVFCNSLSANIDENTHYDVVLQSIKELLDKMNAKDHTVPDQTSIDLIYSKLCAMQQFSRGVPASDVCQLLTAMSALVQLTKLLLQHAKNQDPRLPYALFLFFFLEPGCSPRATKTNSELQTSRYVYKFIALLFASGRSVDIYCQDDFWEHGYFVQQKAARLYFSMMPHSTYENYRLSHLEEMGKQLELPLYEQDHRERLVKSAVPAVRTLQELCRVKLYELVPDRNMLKYIDELGVPEGVFHDYLLLNEDSTKF